MTIRIILKLCVFLTTPGCHIDNCFLRSCEFPWIGAVLQRQLNFHELGPSYSANWGRLTAPIGAVLQRQLGPSYSANWGRLTAPIGAVLQRQLGPSYSANWGRLTAPIGAVLQRQLGLSYSANWGCLTAPSHEQLHDLKRYYFRNSPPRGAAAWYNSGHISHAIKIKQIVRGPRPPRPP